jgi:hypothetical protein
MSGRMARIAALAPLSIGRFSHPARRCRSSVVEHPLGKGEVVSSILTGSTKKMGASQSAPLQNRAEQNAKRRAQTHQIRTKCSPRVPHAEECPICTRQRCASAVAYSYWCEICRVPGARQSLCCPSIAARVESPRQEWSTEKPPSAEPLMKSHPLESTLDAAPVYVVGGHPDSAIARKQLDDRSVVTQATWDRLL